MRMAVDATGMRVGAHAGERMSRRHGLVVGVAVAALTLALVGFPAGTVPATAELDSTTIDGQREVLAEGLANPRHVATGPNGRVYVAEAGKGGDTRVEVTMADGRGPICVGVTGAVTQIDGDTQRRLGALPSWTGTDDNGECPGDGGFALGPHGIAVDEPRHVPLTLGLGSDPGTRSAIAERFEPATRLGTAQRLLPSGRTQPLGDLAAFERAQNPVGSVDSNPYGIAVEADGTRLVADAGGNTLVRVGRGEDPSLVAVFPGEAPQSVPTGVAVGPEGDYYVSELRGVPFAPGSSRIWRIDADRSAPARCSAPPDLPGDGCRVHARGLTSVVDVDIDSDGRAYAVQLADAGVLALEAGGVEQGSLQVIPPEGELPTRAVTGLTAPGGVVVDGDDLYVTTHSVSPDEGKLLRIPGP